MPMAREILYKIDHWEKRFSGLDDTLVRSSSGVTASLGCSSGLRVAARSSAAKPTGRKGFLTNASVGVDPPVLPYLFLAGKIASNVPGRCDVR